MGFYAGAMVELLTSYGKSLPAGAGLPCDFQEKVRTWYCSSDVLTTNITVKTLPLHSQCTHSVGGTQQLTAIIVTVMKCGCESLLDCQANLCILRLKILSSLPWTPLQV